MADSIPTTDIIKDEFIRRFGLLEAISSDKKLQEVELELCRRSPAHFINNWCATFDPRVQPKHFPFALYQFQVEAVQWIEDRYLKKENGLIEKSRDLGATWIVCAWSIHKWIFAHGFIGLFGSQKQELVDDFTIDSIFGKLRYIYERLPKFLKPTSSVPGRKQDTHLSMINPVNGNALLGESANPNFGRGGRSSIAFLDEFAFVPQSEAVWASVTNNSDCVIPLSTPNGKGNEFARLRHETNIPVLSLHWSKHPMRTREWYNKKKETMQDWQIAQELDLSYDKSVRGRIYKRFDIQWHVAREVITYNKDYEQFVTWDFGRAGAMAIVFGQISAEGIVQVWGYFEISDQDIDFCIPIAVRGARPAEYVMLPEQDRRAVDRILKKIPNRSAEWKPDHYGDHAGTAKTANSKRSCKDALEEAGVNLKTTGKQTYDWRIKCLDNLFKLRQNKERNEWSSRFEISPDCQRLIDCLNNYEWDLGRDGDNIHKEDIKPKINQYSHGVTALEFLAINRFPIDHNLSRAREQRIR